MLNNESRVKIILDETVLILHEMVQYLYLSVIVRSTFTCGGELHITINGSKVNVYITCCVTVLMLNNESKVNIYTSSTFARDGTVLIFTMIVK